VICQSFERIHRSNLVGMGVLPLVFKNDQSIQSLELKGGEIVNILGLESLKPRQDVIVEITYADGTTKNVPVLCRIDTEDEMNYYRHGGILQYVLRGLAKAA
jgi:aconitate hydratase